MSGVAVAVGGSALVGAYASSNAAGKQAKAASSAAASQAQSAQDSIDAQNVALDKQIALNQPWQDAGLKALGKYADNPAFKFGVEDFTASPSYQFRQQEGVNALDMSAASRGKLLSGAQDKAITNYGQNLASEEYGNAYNQALQNYNTNQNTQLNLANIGRGAAGQTQSAIQGNSQGVSNALLQNGNNQAQAQYAIGNAYATGAQGMATSINQGIGNGLYAYYKGK
jgi:hypothetical protein